MILVGCDGIWETKSPEKMTKWLHKKIASHQENLEKIVNDLLDEELCESPDSDKGMDNMSAILVKIKN